MRRDLWARSGRAILELPLQQLRGADALQRVRLRRRRRPRRQRLGKRGRHVLQYNHWRRITCRQLLENGLQRYRTTGRRGQQQESMGSGASGFA